MADDTPQHDSTQRLAAQIREAWSDLDGDASVDVRLRPDGKFDLRVVSTRFAGMDSFEREALFWSRIRRLPSTLTVRMTYALLLAPDEAIDYIDEPGEE